MLFNSYIFIFAFLPLCLMGYYLLRGRYATLAKVWLIAFSLWFYGYFNLYYLDIMIGSVMWNYLLNKLMGRYPVKKKMIFTIGVLGNLGVLFYYKYFDFFLSNVNMIFKSDISLKNILLPLGISFFTFQQISFLYDTYKGKMTGVGFIDYALFVTFFPQLIAGPIVTGEEMLPQFASVHSRKFDIDKFANGLYVFTLGLAKKVLIADTLAGAVDYGYANLASISSPEALLVILYYTLQLYFDFSGYCDMAIGIGRMLGFEIAVNFNSPYKSKDIIDFWKRWHITLNRFFTKNIYIPLGGNRKGNARMYFNLFIVFLLSGIWHGAGWNFILWGCMHGVLYVITRAVAKNKKDAKIVSIRSISNSSGAVVVDVAKKDARAIAVNAIKILLTFAFVNLAWVFFRAPDVKTAVELLKVAFTGSWHVPGENFAAFFNLGEFWYVLKILHFANFTFSKYILMIAETIFVLGIVFFAPNVHELAAKQKFTAFRAILTGIILVWCIVSLSGVSTFLYFNF